MIVGPSRSLSYGAPINIHEKPDWLAEAILVQYTRPWQCIVVGGFGGAVNADLNVVAIESDAVQYAPSMPS